MGISTTTYYRWQEEHREIKDTIKKGKAPVDDEVENALLKSALGYEYEETITEIIEQPDGTQRKQIKKVKRYAYPSNNAQIFWLKNRRPEKWRDKPITAEDVSTMEKLDAMLAEVKNHAVNS